MTFNPRDPAQLDAMMEYCKQSFDMRNDWRDNVIVEQELPALIAEIKRLRELLCVQSRTMKACAALIDARNPDGSLKDISEDYMRRAYVLGQALKTEETK